MTESKEKSMVYRLVGVGRDPALKSRRIQNRGLIRTLQFRVGDLIVRPRRAHNVTEDFLQQHKDQILEGVRLGVIQVRDGDNNTIDLEEGASKMPSLKGKSIDDMLGMLQDEKDAKVKSFLKKAIVSTQTKEISASDDAERLSAFLEGAESKEGQEAIKNGLLFQEVIDAAQHRLFELTGGESAAESSSEEGTSEEVSEEAEEAAEIPEGEPEAEIYQEPAADYEDLTVRELKKLVAARNLTPASTRKEDLIEALEEADDQEV